MDDSAVLASVIIPTRNRSDVVEQTVRSLWGQTIGPRKFEIVVVDNVSTDDTPQRLGQLQTVSPVALRYHRMESDGGPAAARNKGASLAAGSALVFLDSDVELDPGWIEAAAGYLALNPDTGIVAGKLLYAARPSFINMFGGELSRIGLGWDAGEGQPSADVQSVVERLWAPTCAAMVRRTMVERIGLFDDTFYFGFEDSDLGWRANLAGFRCVCLPDLIAFHHSTPSGRTTGRTIVFHYAKNRLRSMLKNYSAPSLAKYVPVYLIYTAAELVVRSSRRERWKALVWNVAALRTTWRERASVQRVRRRSDAELFRYFSPRLLPTKTLARRRTEQWALLGKWEIQ